MFCNQVVFVLPSTLKIEEKNVLVLLVRSLLCEQEC